MMQKKTIFIAIIILLLVIGIYQVFIKKEKTAFTLAEVTRGNIIQEVSETGQVKKGEEINLSFKSSGEIEEVYVKVGDKVDTGENLAKLNTRQLEIQLAEARAALLVIEAQKKDAQISLDSARQKLEDTIETCNEKIEKVYKDALSVLDDSYLKIYNCFSFIGLLKRTYFERGDIESITIGENKETIERALNQAKFYIDKSKNSQDKKDIDIALSKTGEALSKTKTALGNIENAIEAGNYRDIVSIADKNNLDTHKLNINTVYSNVVGSQTNISLTKVTNTTEVNTAQSPVLNFENQLQEDEAGLYQAQIKQAQVQIQLLANQMADSYLKSPARSQITKVNKKVGEVVQPMLQDVVISLLPESPFEIEVNVYEEDVVKINIGNPVDISLIAFPDKIFKGKVVAIEPAEKVIEGVVYYKVMIVFDTSVDSTSILSEAEWVEEEIPQDFKPGMTVDVKIKTATKENVLVIPEGAIEKKDGKKIIQVLKDKKIEEREVEAGLEGSDGMVEIVSGVKEGEKVIAR